MASQSNTLTDTKKRSNNIIGDGYYDFPAALEQLLLQNGLVDDLFYLKDLKQRKFYLNSEISTDSIGDIVRNIMQINKEDKDVQPESRQPILLYISSNGGYVDAGFELIDAIETSKTPVYTINLGVEYSMAFIVGLAGHKRYALKNSKFLMHDGSNFVYGSGAKVQDQIDFQKRVESRIKNFIISHSRISEQQYDEKLRVEWYMFADEAKENGFVDKIIGIDCPLDEIV